MGNAVRSVRRPGSVPVRLTRLFGREQELERLADVLGAQRLVSLVGAPGCGKTRLAVELGARVADRWPGGVWFVDLAAVAGGTSVAEAVAVALGVREEPGQELDDRLVDVLSGGDPLLVIVDNCEHVVDAAARLAERLVGACPSVQVLATSRVALGLTGEQVWDVLPLGAGVAAPLFADRAALASSRFRAGNGDGATIEAICERLGGLPLAVELAAASTRMLSVDQILTRLERSLPLVAPGRRDADRRHETMAATVEWSLRLLSPADQRLFARLSVFAGGFDLDAAEAVAGGDGVDVLGGLTTLVDHSLVVADTDVGQSHGNGNGNGHGHGATMGYRLLEPVRQCVAAHLTDEHDDVRRRHAEHYLALAYRFDPLGLRAAPQPVPMGRIEQDEGNLLAALRWARACDPQLALRLCDAMAPFWELGGRVNEGYRRMVDALAATPAGPDLGDGDRSAAMVRITALGGAARICWRHKDYALGRAQLEERLELAVRLGDRRGQAASECTMGLVAFSDGRPGEAVEHCERSIALARAGGDEIVALWAMVTRGWVRYVLGDVAGGSDSFEETLDANRAVRHPSVTAHACLGLQFGAWLAGDVKGQRVHLTGALRAMEAGGVLEQSEWLSSAIALARAEGRLRSAERIYGASLVYGRRRGNEMPEVVSDTVRHWVMEDTDNLRPSIVDRLMAEGERLSWDELVAEALAEPVDGNHPLTRRELQVAGLVADGLANGDIAEQLTISRRTVESHVEKILRKLGFTNRQQIVAWALQELPEV